MTSPLVTPADLGVLLKDDSIDTIRAADIIADVQTLCESYVSPLPAAASVVVKRVAARAYVSTVSPRGPQMGMGGSPFGAGSTGNPGGVVLWKSDVRDLRRLAGGSSAFSIDPLGGTSRAVTVTTTSASQTITAAAGTFAQADVGATITGTGIPAGVTILAVATDASATISVAATASGTITATITGAYALPTDLPYWDTSTGVV